MRHITLTAAAAAVVAGSASSALAIDVAEGRILELRNSFSASVDRTGTSICYSSLDSLLNTGFVGAGGDTIYADDILMNKPAGTRIDEITFSVVSFNNDGSSTGGVVTADVQIGLFNAGPDGLPDFGSVKAIIPVTGIQIGSYSGGTLSVDVKDLNIVKKDEMMWAGLVYTNVVGPANADASTLLSNMGQIIAGAGPANKGFSDDLFFNGGTGGLSFFGGFPANAYANFAWEFRSVPTPGAMAIFGLAGAAATRRRR